MINRSHKWEAAARRALAKWSERTEQGRGANGKLMAAREAVVLKLSPDQLSALLLPASPPGRLG